jgi:prepilin-type N-terminal cleavage/methylation domain-containing protein
MRRAAGFTLIEIAIVLVIIGLLLGAMLKGQELIGGARVQALISKQDGFKAAFFGFHSRYGALPGDYPLASINIQCRATCLNGNGNHRIESSAAPVNGSEVHEEILAWTHLSAAGFLTADLSMSPGDSTPSDANTPRNTYGSFWQVSFDNNFGTTPSAPPRHNLKTGNQFPVEMLAEADRKTDDGLPNTGAFQFSVYAPPGSPAPVGNSPSAPACTGDASPSGTWNAIAGSSNCGAAILL